MASSADPLSIPRKVLKLLVLPLGFGLSLICCMALVGGLSANGWVRGGVAAVACILVPALIADRLIPDDPSKGKGLLSDVFALSWLFVPLIVSLALGAWTRALLVTEAERQSSAGRRWVARIAFVLAGVEPQWQGGTAGPSPSASASGAGSASSAGPGPSASGGAVLPKPPPKANKELSDSAIFKRFAPAVVTIKIKGRSGGFVGGGTGFLIDSAGRIVTNHHVIDSAIAHGAEVGFMHGARYSDVTLLMSDSAIDLALLQVDLARPKKGKYEKVAPVVLGKSAGVVVGERAISIGNPLGLEHTLTTGVVSARRKFNSRKWIQMSTPISPGNSGGPVFNGFGEVMGVSTAQIGGGIFGGRAQNLNLAVPIDELRSRLKSSYPKKRKLGGGSTRASW